MAANGKSGSTGLASSMTDLMTSLMVIFVLLLVATLNNASAEGENTRNLILDQLRIDLQDFAQKGVRVEKDPADPLGLLVLVPEGLLNFAVDKSDIPKGGIEFLSVFAPRLASTSCNSRYKKEISSIVVEGHTDSSGSLSERAAIDEEIANFEATVQVLRARTGDLVPSPTDADLDDLGRQGFIAIVVERLRRLEENAANPDSAFAGAALQRLYVEQVLHEGRQ